MQENVARGVQVHILDGVCPSHVGQGSGLRVCWPCHLLCSQGLHQCTPGQKVGTLLLDGGHPGACGLVDGKEWLAGTLMPFVLLPCALLPCVLLPCALLPCVLLPCALLPCVLLPCALLPCVSLLPSEQAGATFVQLWLQGWDCLPSGRFVKGFVTVHIIHKHVSSCIVKHVSFNH